MNHSQLSFNRTASAGGSPQFNRLHTASLVLSAARAHGDASGVEDASEAGRCFHAAVALYEAAQWRKAYSMLVKLADGGHAAAARLALLMLRYGAPIYGAAFTAAPKQIARWATQVLREARRESSPAEGSGEPSPEEPAHARSKASASAQTQITVQASAQALSQALAQTIAPAQRFADLDDEIQHDLQAAPDAHAWHRFQAAANDDFADDSGFTAARVPAPAPRPRPDRSPPSRSNWTSCIA